MAKVKLQLGAELETLTAGELDTALAKHSDWERQAAFGMRHQDLPRMIGTPNGGVLALGADQPDQPPCGPGAGWYWAVQRISVDGLSTVPATSINNQGSATGPTAGQALTSILLPSGEWLINWQLTLSGTITGAEANNAQLFSAFTGSAILQSSNAAAAGTYPQEPVTVSGGQRVFFQAINNAGAAAVYTGQITAEPVVTPPMDSVKLYKESKYICTVPAIPGFATFGKHGLVMKPGDYLRVVGTGLVATGQIEVYGEAVTVPGPLMWKILS